MIVALVEEGLFRIFFPFAVRCRAWAVLTGYKFATDARTVFSIEINKNIWFRIGND